MVRAHSSSRANIFQCQKENVILTAQLVTKKKKRLILDSLHSLDMVCLNLDFSPLFFNLHSRAGGIALRKGAAHLRSNSAVVF